MVAVASAVVVLAVDVVVVIEAALVAIPSSRSLKLHIIYFENGDRYDNGVYGS